MILFKNENIWNGNKGDGIMSGMKADKEDVRDSFLEMLYVTFCVNKFSWEQALLLAVKHKSLGVKLS